MALIRLKKQYKPKYIWWHELVGIRIQTVAWEEAPFSSRLICNSSFQVWWWVFLVPSLT